MNKITILPEELSNRIAAGEVVERPASVVKELFENAVDAGADNIIVEIERAGSRLIKVSDNGCGMNNEDALLCFSPHATSKIKNAEDIERITTLGFRGEALPSIASVSRLSLKTRTADNPEGLEIELLGGKVVDQHPAGMPPGTVFAVRDLFFNVPARKKFLRSPATEEAHIQETVTALALGFPHVSVTLKFDNKIALQAPGEKDPAARAAGLFGKSFAGKMIAVNYTAEDVSVNGLIAEPGFTRTSRREQRTFVNGRAVESPALYRGIRDGYGTLADFGRFPPTMLNVVMDASEYDINVHPTKREVRFKREYIVSRAVTNAVMQTLHRQPAPEMVLPSEKKLAQPDVLLAAASISYQVKPSMPEIPGLREESPAAKISTCKASAAIPQTPASEQKTLPEFQQYTHPSPVMPPVEKIAVSAAETAPHPVYTSVRPVIPTTAEEADKFTDRNSTSAILPPPATQHYSPLAEELMHVDELNYVGILFGTFVMVEALSGETVYLIDFHAAHERVLYEELLEKSRNGENSPSQQLLLPPAIELSRTAAAFIGKNEKLFSTLGFDTALLSSNTVLLNAVPANLPENADWETVLSDLVNMVLEGEKHTRDSLEAIARAACHSAVKANDPLNDVTAKALLKNLALCQRPDVCPHGRPTVLKITKNELSRRFGRI